MKTAIVTGASSGLGREFVRQIEQVFPEIECYWLIARRGDRLEEMAKTLTGKTVVCFPLDLCDSMSFLAYQEKLRGEQPEVVLLINNAGCGYLGNVGQTELASQTRMVDLNVRALTAITHMTVPYMGAGSPDSQCVFHCLLLSQSPSDGVFLHQGLCFILYHWPGGGAAQPEDRGDGSVSRSHEDGVFGRGRHHGKFPDV